MARSRPAVPREALPEKEDRRVLRFCFLAAALLHGVLLLLPVPWTDAAAAPEPPPRVIHQIVAVRPAPPPEPEPFEPPPEPREPRLPVPVPETFVDEPILDRTPLPAPDLEALAELPVILPEGPPPPVEPEPQPDLAGPVHVVGAIVPPEAVFAPRPNYPEAARRARRPGTVVLQATIDREGRVTELEILLGAPLGMTEAALAAVRRWRFRPATLEDRPVAVYYHLTVRFETR
jgi:protein TonB